MIFLTKYIEPFIASTGMRILVQPCELINGEKGWFIENQWLDEIESKTEDIRFVPVSKIKRNAINGSK